MVCIMILCHIFFFFLHKLTFLLENLEDVIEVTEGSNTVSYNTSTDSPIIPITKESLPEETLSTPHSSKEIDEISPVIENDEISATYENNEVSPKVENDGVSAAIEDEYDDSYDSDADYVPQLNVIPVKTKSSSHFIDKNTFIDTKDLNPPSLDTVLPEIEPLGDTGTSEVNVVNNNLSPDTLKNQINEDTAPETNEEITHQQKDKTPDLEPVISSTNDQENNDFELSPVLSDDISQDVHVGHPVDEQEKQEGPVTTLHTQSPPSTTNDLKPTFKENSDDDVSNNTESKHFENLEDVFHEESHLKESHQMLSSETDVIPLLETDTISSSEGTNKQEYNEGTLPNINVESSPHAEDPNEVDFFQNNESQIYSQQSDTSFFDSSIIDPEIKSIKHDIDNGLPAPEPEPFDDTSDISSNYEVPNENQENNNIAISSIDDDGLTDAFDTPNEDKINRIESFIDIQEASEKTQIMHEEIKLINDTVEISNVKSDGAKSPQDLADEKDENDEKGENDEKHEKWEDNKNVTVDTPEKPRVSIELELEDTGVMKNDDYTNDEIHNDDGSKPHKNDLYLHNSETESLPPTDKPETEHFVATTNDLPTESSITNYEITATVNDFKAENIVSEDAPGSNKSDEKAPEIENILPLTTDYPSTEDSTIAETLSSSITPPDNTLEPEINASTIETTDLVHGSEKNETVQPNPFSELNTEELSPVPSSPVLSEHNESNYSAEPQSPQKDNIEQKEEAGNSQIIPDKSISTNPVEPVTDITQELPQLNANSESTNEEEGLTTEAIPEIPQPETVHISQESNDKDINTSKILPEEQPTEDPMKIPEQLKTITGSPPNDNDQKSETSTPMNDNSNNESSEIGKADAKDTSLKVKEDQTRRTSLRRSKRFLSETDPDTLIKNEKKDNSSIPSVEVKHKVGKRGRHSKKQKIQQNEVKTEEIQPEAQNETTIEDHIDPDLIKNSATQFEKEEGSVKKNNTETNVSLQSKDSGKIIDETPMKRGGRNLRSRDKAPEPSTPSTISENLVSKPVVQKEEEGVYCFCKKYAVGKMIACDNPSCKIEWFHWSCVGINVEPKGNWICPGCQKELDDNTVKPTDNAAAPAVAATAPKSRKRKTSEKSTRSIPVPKKRNTRKQE